MRRTLTRPALRLAVLAPAILAAACMHKEAPEPGQTEAPAEAPALSDSPAAATEAPAPAPKPDPNFLPPAPEPGQVPHVYMALQPGGTGHPDSVVFAIDAARNGTPSDDPAMRLTPEGGLCNPQEMSNFDFAAAGITLPVVSEVERAEGLTPADLPAFMAVAVTNAMLDQGLAAGPEDTRPLNICTRKLWERLVVVQNSG